MLFIVLSLVLLILGGVFWFLDCRYKTMNFDCPALLLLMFGGIALVMALAAIPIHRNSVYADIARYEAIRQTVAISRERGETTELERIKLAENIIETNMDLAKAKYYAKHPWFKLYYPEEVLEVEPIY